VAAVAQVTEQGFVFVFDRTTGAPLREVLSAEGIAVQSIGREPYRS